MRLSHTGFLVCVWSWCIQHRNNKIGDKKNVSYMLRLTIANQVNNVRNAEAYGAIRVNEIVRVRVRPGCSEMEVDILNPDRKTVVIETAPILTEMINALLSDD
jgi:hypothetical protein